MSRLLIPKHLVMVDGSVVSIYSIFGNFTLDIVLGNKMEQIVSYSIIFHKWRQPTDHRLILVYYALFI